MHPYKQSGRFQDGCRWVLTWRESGWGILPSTILLIQNVPGGNVNILGGHNVGHSKQKSVYVHVSYSERFQRYICTVAKLLILHIVSNIGIYCSSAEVGTVYLVLYIFENSPSTSVHYSARVRTWLLARPSASWLPFMQEMTSIMRSSISPRVSTFVLYPSFFIQPHNKNLTRRGTAGVKDNIGRQIQTPVQ
jgi:hypothetical protein